MTQTLPGADEPSASDDLDAAKVGNHAARGAKVVMLGQAGRIGVQIVSVVVLARLLDPSAYGTFALALAIVSLGEVFRDFGLSSAAIQARHLSRDQQSNLFWINVGIGAVLAAACFLGSPLLSWATHQPDSARLLRVMACVFVLNGAVSQYRADLNRRLRFEALVVSDVVGPLAGVAGGVVGALQGWGYWSLAVQQILGAFVTTLLAVILAGWLPRLPSRRGDVRPMLRFGVGMAGTQLVGYFNNYIDTLTIGFRLGSADLGVYDRAYQLLMRTLNQFRNPTMSVALPLLARLEPGTESANRTLLRGQAALGYTIVAGSAFAAGAAVPIIGLALGPQWHQSAAVFAILAIAGGLQTIGFVSAWVYVSRGLTSELFVYSCMSLAIRVTFVLIGSQWGLLGVAIGYTAAPAVGVPFSYIYLSRRTPIPLRGLLLGAARAIGSAGGAGAATLLVQRALAGEPDLVQIGACLVTTVGVYGVLAAALRPVRADVLAVLRFGRQAMTSRRPAARARR